MSQHSSKMPSQRQLQVGEKIRHALSHYLMRESLYHPQTNEELNITVSEVRIAPDMRQATVFVMPLGGQNKETTLETLEKYAGKLSHVIARTTTMKYTPKLQFKLDEVFDYADKINKLSKQDQQLQVEQSQTEQSQSE